MSALNQVGRVSPQVWAAAASLLAAASTGAWREAAASLVALGATTTGAGAGGGAAMSAADVAAFGDELAALAAAAGAVRAAVVVEAGDAAGAGFGGGGGAAGGRPPPPGGARVGVAVDEAGAAALLAQLLDVASRRGLRLPRAFGLLVKQLLYFDRYARILAPDLDVLADGRVRLGGSQAEAARGAPAPPRRSYA